jgi:hypothetical protein
MENGLQDSVQGVYGLEFRVLGLQDSVQGFLGGFSNNCAFRFLVAL